MRVQDVFQELTINQYRRKGALWIHDGNPGHPHAILTTSGSHSNGYFNSRLITEDPELLSLSATRILLMLTEHKIFPHTISCVVGPEHGATPIADSIAEIISKLFGFECSSVHAEKLGGGDEKQFLIEEGQIEQGEPVLLVEDVITTGKSVRLVCDAVESAGGVVLPYICALVNRTGLSHVNGKKVFALVEHEMPAWKLEECPLCKQGSEAIRPKDNWDRLIAA